MAEDKLEYAGFWRRFAASVIDGGILVAIGIGISFTLGTDPFPQEVQTPLEIIDVVLTTTLDFILVILFWLYYYGQTPGKRLLAIKIITQDQKALTLPVAIIRYCAYFVSFVVVGLGYFWVAWHPKNQGWHDLIAQTYVIKTGEIQNKGLVTFLTLSTIAGFIALMLYVASISNSGTV